MKKKLVLNKKTITELSQKEQSKVLGGSNEAWTTSFGSCTGGLCCSAQPTTSQLRLCPSDNLPNGCPSNSPSPLH
ncbi:hypothetical protein SAMN05421827_12512 [Pedobacter terrae]|uniref:Natural product n=1 Tax=Pedobacter terrae TaxID=405671 RepID=A0A1G8CK90_9SPHI|nr:class I lanthipeptide [Pedobacter terrae]SDH45320.1 hypothetical protein SAMN05421827_12512 [Pedobacter terrae]